MENKKHRIRAIGNFFQSILLLLFRVFWGYQFAISGFGKFLHYPDIVSYFQSIDIPYAQYAVGVIGAIELIGGLLLIFGIFTRITAIPLFLLMVGAFKFAEKEAVDALIKNHDVMPIMNATPYLFAVAALLLFCFGPGKIAVDYIIGGFNKTKEMP